MRGKRAARPDKQVVRKRWLLALVSALLALAVVGAIAPDVGGSLFSGDQRNASGDQKSSTPQSADGSSATSSVRACADEVSRASDVVEAAARGVSHWSSHVQARTDMLDGRIPVTTMDAIWKRTRLAGPADQSRFEAAHAGYHSTSRCEGLHGGSASGSDSAAGCVERSQAATRAVAAADAAMRDWRSHLANMSRYAHDQMSQKTAQGKWVSAWRAAPANISAYRSARDALDQAPSCEVPQ